MAISKRLRYEVLRRDNHTCRYCGAAAPAAALTVDHVVPVSLGGKDEPGNLVAACKDCNAGKSSSNPDQPLVDDVAADTIRWSHAMLRAAAVAVADLDRREELRSRFAEAWNGYTIDRGRTLPLPAGWPRSVDTFLAAGLPLAILIECVDIAMSNSTIAADRVFRYMCGVAWKRVESLQEAARQSLTPAPGGDAEPDDNDYWEGVSFVYSMAIRDLFDALGKDHCQRLWRAVVATHKRSGTSMDYLADDDHEMARWIIQALASELAVVYLQQLDKAEWSTWGWSGSGPPVDFGAIAAAKAARMFKEEGKLPSGRCMTVVEGLPCAVPAQFKVKFACCRMCPEQTCAGHEGLCVDHLQDVKSTGYRDQQGNVAGVLTDFTEISDPWAVSV